MWLSQLFLAQLCERSNQDHDGEILKLFLKIFQLKNGVATIAYFGKTIEKQKK